MERWIEILELGVASPSAVNEKNFGGRNGGDRDVGIILSADAERVEMFVRAADQTAGHQDAKQNP